MRKQQVLGKEVLGKVVKFDIGGAEMVRSCNAADAGQFMHILQEDDTH